MSRSLRFDALMAQLRALIDETEAGGERQPEAVAEAAARLLPGDFTELIVGARRIRNREFGLTLFGEPAWDILLGLHLAYCRGQSVSITAAITFGETPPTTGLRWLGELERLGLIERQGDPNDHRRVFVGLSYDAVKKMDKYVEAYAAWVAIKAVMRGS